MKYLSYLFRVLFLLVSIVLLFGLLSNCVLFILEDFKLSYASSSNQIDIGRFIISTIGILVSTVGLLIVLQIIRPSIKIIPEPPPGIFLVITLGVFFLGVAIMGLLMIFTGNFNGFLYLLVGCQMLWPLYRAFLESRKTEVSVSEIWEDMLRGRRK
jgi:hypothetical protein